MALGTAQSTAPAPALAGVILQRESTAEVRAVLTACMLASPSPLVRRAAAAELPQHYEALVSGHFMPVGSVEFVGAAMALARIAQPRPDPYPLELAGWLHRQITITTAFSALSSRNPLFLKPADLVKAFDGFVLRPSEPPDEHGGVQLAALRSLAPDTRVFVCQPVEFLSEWRFYVLAGRILECGRYDPDGADDAPTPDERSVQAAITAYGRRGAYALDMGVLTNGATALVEVNDAWATGLYAGALTPAAYYTWLASRWVELVAAG